MYRCTRPRRNLCKSSPCCPHIHSLLFLFYLPRWVLTLCASPPTLCGFTFLSLCYLWAFLQVLEETWSIRSSPLFPVHLMQHHGPSQGLLLWVYASPLGIANSKQKRYVWWSLSFCVWPQAWTQPLPQLSKRHSQNQLWSIVYTLERTDGMLSLLRLAGLKGLASN